MKWMKSIVYMLLVAVTMTGAVFSHGIAESDIGEVQKQELQYMAELGFSLDQIEQKTISGKVFAQLLDKLVEYAAPDKLAQWSSMYPHFRSAEKELRRIDVLSALFLALNHIGGDYCYYKVDFNDPMHHAIFADGDVPDFDMFGSVTFDIEGWGNDHYGVGGYIYNVSRKSPVEGEYPMSYDQEAGSFRMFEQATYLEAAQAIIRAIRLGEAQTIISVDDPAALTPDGMILTGELIAKANENPVVTSENHPRWTGLVLGYGYEYEFGTSAEEVSLTAEWGFNTARLNLHYLTLFSEDAKSVNLIALRKLDELVASAIEHDIHFNICLLSIPGRSVLNKVSDYQYMGDFDLFINPEKQELAFNVYRVLASRYKDIPNFNLSITPVWEPLNKNLSTGLPAPEYTEEDVAVFLGKAIDVIRAEDPDRLIIYEPTPTNHQDNVIRESAPTKAVADGKGNVMISYNFCQNPYVYACMTATAGEHIDNMNNSMFVAEYPNYIYSVASSLWVDAGITLNGLLPAGMTLDLYVENTYSGAVLDICADGESLYSEELFNENYEVGERLSGYYPFATSEKQISVTLTEDVEEITISCLKDGGFDICGIRLTMPEEYAVERWYNVQGYDVFTGVEKEEGIFKKSSSTVLISPNDHDSGREITIHEDLSYTSEHVFDEASAETIEAWSEAIDGFDGNCVIRFERAEFSGTTWTSMATYYEDLLKSFKEYGFSWWSNDWWLLTDEFAHRTKIAECPVTEYAGYKSFNLELLQLLQKYQNKD